MYGNAVLLLLLLLTADSLRQADEHSYLFYRLYMWLNLESICSLTLVFCVALSFLCFILIIVDCGTVLWFYYFCRYAQLLFCCMKKVNSLTISMGSWFLFSFSSYAEIMKNVYFIYLAAHTHANTHRILNNACATYIMHTLEVKERHKHRQQRGGGEGRARAIKKKKDSGPKRQ